MINWRSKHKKSPRIFLGALAVASRDDLKSIADQWGLLKNEDLDSGIRRSLEDIFTFPRLNKTTHLSANDLILDIVVPDYQAGEVLGGSLLEIPLLFMWRPKLTVFSRLYSRKTNKSVLEISVTEKMPLRYYFGRVFSRRGFWRLRPLFDTEDMDYLLREACHKLLTKIQKAL